MKKNKSFFCIIFFVFKNIFLFAQIILNDTIPKDPLMPSRPEVINYNYEFLIKDNFNYLCYIKKIISLKNGYLINANIKIDTFNVDIYIISKKSNLNDVKKIRPKHSYNLFLNRYFDFPIYAGIPTYSNKNIMISEKNIHIGASGYFYYLFISDNLDGLEYIDSNIIDLKKRDFNINKNSIDTLIMQFLKTISFSNKFDSIGKYVDTNSTKKMFQNYCFPHEIRKNLSIRIYPYWVPFHRIKLKNWKSIGVNPNNFQELLTNVVNREYRLPVKNEISNESCLILKRQILNISKDFIYTVRIYWKIDGVKDVYAIILSIKQFDEEFKIIGINAFMVPSNFGDNQIYNGSLF